MSDPKHPAKIVIVVQGGRVCYVFTDKKVDARIFIADYDNIEHSTMIGPDRKGQRRSLHEETTLLDTAAVRNIINKKKCECGKPQCGKGCSELDASQL